MLLTIDHVGIACRNLDAAIERYVSVFGLAVVSQETNTGQGVREAMLATSSGSSYVQLLEPLSPDTPVGKFLERRGEGMHHVGYAVADVSAALAEIGATGVRLIDARPRHGSMGASIAFLHPGDLGGVLTELVQPLLSPGGTTPRTPRCRCGRGTPLHPRCRRAALPLATMRSFASIVAPEVHET